MENYSRKLSKRLARGLQASREHLRSRAVNRHEHIIVGSLKVRYKHPKKEWVDLGVVSEAIVTDAAIAILLNVLRGGDATTLQSFKFHDSGTDTTAEAASDTNLGASVAEGRDEGTQESGGTGIYRSVATHTYFDTADITEHGIFSSFSGGTLLDRSVFAAIEVISGTQIEFTYDLTLTGS